MPSSLFGGVSVIEAGGPEVLADPGGVFRVIAWSSGTCLGNNDQRLEQTRKVPEKQAIGQCSPTISCSTGPSLALALGGRELAEPGLGGCSTGQGRTALLLASAAHTCHSLVQTRCPGSQLYHGAWASVLTPGLDSPADWADATLPSLSTG